MVSGKRCAVRYKSRWVWEVSTIATPNNVAVVRNCTKMDMMEHFDPTYIIVIVLVSIVLILLVTIAVAALLLVYRRRMWCFNRRLDQAKLLQSDLERYGQVRNKRRHKRNRVFERKRRQRKPRKHKKKSKYHSLGKAPRFPKSDPFTNKFLENPLIADDEFDMDWTNPAFDSEAAIMYDATITIQSWYRMIRYDTASVQHATFMFT